MKWDLHYESPRLVALRTATSDNPHIWEEPRFRDSDSRPITHWGFLPAEVGPMVAPGKYSVLTVAGQSFTQPLTVRLIRAFRLRKRTSIVGEDAASHSRRHYPRFRYLQSNRVATEANRGAGSDAAPAKEEGRKRGRNCLGGRGGRVQRHRKFEPAPPQGLSEAETKHKADLLKAAEALDKKVLSIEHKLVSQALLNSDDKYFVEPYQLYLNPDLAERRGRNRWRRCCRGCPLRSDRHTIGVAEDVRGSDGGGRCRVQHLYERRYSGIQSRSRRQRFSLSHCGIGFNRSAGCAFWIDICFSL